MHFSCMIFLKEQISHRDNTQCYINGNSTYKLQKLYLSIAKKSIYIFLKNESEHSLDLSESPELISSGMQVNNCSFAS